MDVVELTKRAEKDLKKVPKHIRAKFDLWRIYVEEDGIKETRKIPSFHDEPLLGDRKGQRSIRLSKAYRAIYIEEEREETTEKEKKIFSLLEIQEVNKHDY